MLLVPRFAWSLHDRLHRLTRRSAQVPFEMWAHTPVMLLATAGMRMMPPHASEAVLAACRRELHRSHLAFQDEWAYLVSGQDEGVFAWIAANYATGALSPVRSPPAHTTHGHPCAQRSAYWCSTLRRLALRR